MGALRRLTNENGGVSYQFWCSGCAGHHSYTTKLGEGETGPVWTYDGNEEAPTFSPSLLANPQIKGLCSCQDSEECDQDSHAKPDYGYHRCHLFLRAGMVQYLSDCTHSLAGKTVPVEPPRF